MRGQGGSGLVPKGPVTDKRLLEPGWPGDLGPDEMDFVKSALKASRRLRTAWGFVHGTGRLSEEAIRVVAMRGLPDNRAHNIALVKAVKDPEGDSTTDEGDGLQSLKLYNGALAEEQAPQASVQLGFGLGEVGGVPGGPPGPTAT